MVKRKKYKNKTNSRLAIREKYGNIKEVEAGDYSYIDIIPNPNHFEEIAEEEKLKDTFDKKPKKAKKGEYKNKK